LFPELLLLAETCSVAQLSSKKLASSLLRFKKPKSPSQKQLKSTAAPSSGLISSSSTAGAKVCSTSALTGDLCTDPTILMYVKQLDDHRKKCELSGR
jgi:hypothetical protein